MRKILEITSHELAFQFQSDEKEKDREKTVGGPRANREVQPEIARADRRVSDRLIDRS